MSDSDDKKSEKKNAYKRMNLRIHSETAMRAEFWAEREGISYNAFVIEAIEEKIARHSGVNVGEESLVLSRLNELIDATNWTGNELMSMMQIFTTVMDQFTVMARGDNFLLDDDRLDTGARGQSSGSGTGPGQAAQSAQATQGPDFDNMDWIADTDDTEISDSSEG